MPIIVELTAVWLNLASDPSVSQSFWYVTSLQPSVETRGTVRVMASGRMRAVKQAGKSRAYQWTLEQCTRAQIDWLEEYVGELVCVRDDRGRKWFGIYTVTPVAESTQWRDRGDISLSLSEISHSEVV